MTHRWLWLGALSLSLVALGCGRTDPRTRPGYVDTANPKDGAKHMKESSPLSNQKKPDSKAGTKVGGS